MRRLAPILCLVVLAACGGGRTAPEGLDAPRADRLPRLRVERLLARGQTGVPLERLHGTFRVVRAGAVVDLPYVAALVLEGPDGERVRLLFDHHPEETVLVRDGAPLTVRYTHAGDGAAPHAALSLRDEAGDLLFASIVRAPNAVPSAEEERLPLAVRPEPTDERVYREFLRQESWCTTERDHFAARLADGARWRRLAPGGRTTMTVGDRTWRVHLLDLSRVARTDCAVRPPDWMAFQVYAAPPE